MIDNSAAAGEWLKSMLYWPGMQEIGESLDKTPSYRFFGEETRREN
jgi:hypothetical protein